MGATPPTATTQTASAPVLCTPPYHSSFSDVVGGPHINNILCLADRGLVQGTDGVNYAPRQHVTRGQMASFITRFVEECTATTLPVGNGRFVDLAGAHAHTGNIHKLYEAQITDGIGSPGQFAPLQSITREQVASFISRALSFIASGQARPEHQPPRVERTAFPDVRSLHRGNINALADVGILEGYPDGLYRPTQSLTRDQMASVIARAYQWILPSCHTDEEPAPEPTVEIVAPTTSAPVQAEPGDNVDVTLSATDGASYVIEIRPAGGDWRPVAGGAGGTLTDGTTTVTITLPSDLAAGAYDVRATVINPSGSATDMAQDAIDVVIPVTVGDLTGTITVEGLDGAAPAAGATVTATNVDDPSIEVSTTADEQGNYSFADLPPGDYRVVAQLPGFVGTPAEVAIVPGDNVVDDQVSSTVTGAFAATVGSTPLGTDPLVVNTTLDDVTVGFERTDGGDPIDAKVSLRLLDADDNPIDWTDPAAGIFTPDTIALLLDMFGAGADDPTYTIDGDGTITLLDGVSIGLGPNADHIDRLILDLVDARFLPTEIVHERGEIDLAVLGTGDRVEVELTGLADDYEQGTTHTGTESVSFTYTEGRGNITDTFNVFTVVDEAGTTLEPSELDGLFADLAFVDDAGQASDHIRPLHGTQPEAVVAPATVALGIEFGLQPDAPFGSYTLRLIAYDVSGVPANDVSLAAALGGAYDLLDQADAAFVVFESHDMSVDILDVGGLPFASGIEAFAGRSVDMAVRLENHNVERALDEGWFLAFEVNGFASAQSVTFEVCDRAPMAIPVLTNCQDATHALTPISLTDGRWLLQIGGLTEPAAIAPGAQRWHHFRIAFGELGSFTNEFFLFEGA